MRRSPAVAIVVAMLAAVLAPSRAVAQSAPAAPAAPVAPAPPEAAAPAAAPAAPTPAASPAGESAGAAAAASAAEAPAAPFVASETPAFDPAAAASAAASAAAVDPAAAASIAAAATAAAPIAAPPPAPAAAVKAPVAEAKPARPSKPWRTLPLIGFSLGAGFPDLVNANLLVRPLNWIRLYGGPAWSYVSWGMQGGVVLSPINWYVTPTLSFQAGRLFRTDASRFLKDDDPDQRDMKPLLKKLDYHYYAGDFGLELGSPRGFNFFLRFGLSFAVIKANGTGGKTNDDGSRVSISNPKVSAWLPSAKLGFQYWF